MIGTIVNCTGIIIGGVLGLLLKKGIPKHINDAILKIEGLVVLIIGLNGVLTSMLKVDLVSGKISDNGSLLLLVSLVLGCLAGEFLKIDDKLDAFGKMVEQKSGTQGFARGFITASLIFSIGAMGIVGALNDGLSKDSSILFVKTGLDTTTAIFLASALGFGVVFSFVPVLLVQGTVSILSVALAPLLSDELMGMFCMVGYAVVLTIGLNFLCDTKIKTANLLPALLVPIIYYIITKMLRYLVFPTTNIW